MYKYIEIDNISGPKNINLHLNNIKFDSYCNILFLKDIRFNSGKIFCKKNIVTKPEIKIPDIQFYRENRSTTEEEDLSQEFT